MPALLVRVCNFSSADNCSSLHLPLLNYWAYFSYQDLLYHQSCATYPPGLYLSAGS